MMTPRWYEIEKCSDCGLPYPLRLDDEKRYDKQRGFDRDAEIGVCCYCKAPITAGAKAAHTRK